jgi:hypothetical protein
MFVSLRNLSVSTKEMVHRIYKEATVKTNKINLLRDLMVYENDMQALRFLGENIRDQHEMQNSELAELFSAGFFRSLYLESHEELFARGCLSGMRKLESNAASGDDDFVGVQVHGEPLNMARVTALMPGLQGNRLNYKQMGELFKVYDSIGIHQIQPSNSLEVSLIGCEVERQHHKLERMAIKTTMVKCAVRIHTMGNIVVSGS